MELDGKIVLLTGASSGIGAATASVLGAAGADVISHHRDNTDRPGALEALANVNDSRKHFIGAEFGNAAATDKLWNDAVGWKGHVDVLVLNAAITRTHDGVASDDDEAWLDTWSSQWQINVLAPARLMRNAVRHFKMRGGGIIITMSSWVAQRGATNPGDMAYAASKSAVAAAAKTIARGYAADRILSYIIAPGIVRTKMSEDFASLQGGEEKVTNTLAMKEWVPPKEIGELIAFLAAGKCRHLSGATLDVNGATYVR